MLAYTVSRRCFGPLAGLISIGIMAIVPLDIAMATTLYPDAIAAFLANVGICLILYNSDNAETRYASIIAVLSGICFGVSWLCKETVVYLSPFVVIYYLRIWKPGPLIAWSHLLYMGVGVLLVIVAEMAFYRVVVGDWLYHFHAVEENYKQGAVWFFDQSSPYFGWDKGGYTKALAKRLFVTGPSRDNSPGLAGIAQTIGIT